MPAARALTVDAATRGPGARSESTSIPERIRASMTDAERWEGVELAQFRSSLVSDLRPVFGNSAGPVVLLPESHHQGWEAVITNLLRTGDRVLVARTGGAAEGWKDLASGLGIDVVTCGVPCGESTPLGLLQHLLWWDPAIKAVFVAHNEVSTGVTTDVAAVRRAIPLRQTSVRRSKRFARPRRFSRTY